MTPQNIRRPLGRQVTSRRAASLLRRDPVRRSARIAPITPTILARVHANTSLPQWQACPELPELRQQSAVQRWRSDCGGDGAVGVRIQCEFCDAVTEFQSSPQRFGLFSRGTK